MDYSLQVNINGQKEHVLVEFCLASFPCSIFFFFGTVSTVWIYYSELIRPTLLGWSLFRTANISTLLLHPTYIKPYAPNHKGDEYNSLSYKNKNKS